MLLNQFSRFLLLLYISQFDYIFLQYYVVRNNVKASSTNVHIAKQLLCFVQPPKQYGSRAHFHFCQTFSIDSLNFSWY